MDRKYAQKDYFLYLIHYDKVLEYLEKELEAIEKNGSKTLWFWGAQSTLEHLKKEEGKNLNPHDIDNIIHALLSQVQKKEKKEI